MNPSCNRKSRNGNPSPKAGAPDFYPDPHLQRGAPDFYPNNTNIDLNRRASLRPY